MCAFENCEYDWRDVLFMKSHSVRLIYVFMLIPDCRFDCVRVSNGGFFDK